MNMTEQIRVNRSYKDRLFRFIFNDKKGLFFITDKRIFQKEAY